MMNTIKTSLRNVASGHGAVASGDLYPHQVRTSATGNRFTACPLCDPARMSFDVGSNWGQYAEAMSSVSSGVVAFEPVPQLADYLRRTAAKGVRVQQGAAF